MQNIKKYFMTLALLLTAVTGAWAEEKMVTINSSTMSSGAVTATGFNIILDNYLYVNKNPATITTSEGVITKLVIKKSDVYVDAFTEANVGVTPGTITYGSDEITVTDINAESVTLSRKGDDNWSTSSVDVYYDAAASAVTVDWNKTAKTGTFTMPGGNVTLEPEYYPQAALTAAPTAINDVPATTDGAIVKAGTVANIGSTETAQGTVMYYVSPTALDDAALLALAADAWTADVPTAESLAQGQAYVYYYVRGNDSDTDEENFSDGDILAANALTVTIAAEPTYAVTFADDTAEPTLWTASPNADVTKGQTVTVTYTGTKKVIGVKAEKKAETFAADEYNEASWVDTNKKVVYEKKKATTTPVAVADAATNVTWDAGWYTVSGNVTITGDVTLTADTHLILQDGATLTINGKLNCKNNYNLYIYGQKKGDGKLNVTNNSGTAIISNKHLDIHGGEVTASAAGNTGSGLLTGYLAVYGGKLTATSGITNGIVFGNTIDVYGGEVVATSNAISNSVPCYGIQGGSSASKILTVYGGKVTATGNGKESSSSYGSGFGCNVKSGTSGIKFYFSADGTTWGDGTSYTSATKVGLNDADAATKKRYAKAE